MIEAHEFAPWSRHSQPVNAPTTRELLVSGGDARLALDPFTERNRYGCPAGPDPRLDDFASSTGSVISAPAFAAAEALRQRLYAADPRGPGPATYAVEIDRLRGRLKHLCGLEDLAGLEVLFSPSGTDLHLIISELAGATPTSPLTCIDVEPEETGSGVPAALSGRHFGASTALGALVVEGGAVTTTARRFVAVRARDAEGALRPGDQIEAELDAAAQEAIAGGGRVLLAVSDVSKTGLISPGLEAVLAFKHRFGAAAEIVIDACQLRLTPAALRAYLGLGFMVAVTGSKFVSGPSFSGALFVPAEVAQRLSGRLISTGLRAYSNRAEWPRDWAAGASLPDTVNPGLLLRWEAALSELEAFRALPEPAVLAFADRFAATVQAHIDAEPLFEPLEVRALNRQALGVGAGWDLTPTIFPFLLRHAPGGREGYLSLAATQDVYRGLTEAERPARLGQPVRCGERDGRPISALRLCNSARLMVEAVSGGGAGEAAVIARALDVLDRTAAGVRRMSATGRV